MPTTYRGQDGSLSFAGGAVAQTKEWSLSAQIDEIDQSTQGPAWKDFTPGQGEATGQAVVEFNYGDTGQKAIVDAILAASPTTTPATAIFKVSGTKTITWSVFVQAMGLPAQLGSTIRVTFGFRCTGAPTLAWA